MLCSKSIRFYIAWLLFAASTNVVHLENCFGQKKEAEEVTEALQPVDPADLTTLLGHTVEITFNDGYHQAFLEVTDTIAGKAPGGLRSIKIRPVGARKKKTINAKNIVEIYLDEQPLDVTYDRKQRSLIHDPEKRSARIAHDERVTSRLRSIGHRKWQPLTDQQQAEFVNKQRKFLEEVQEALPHVEFRLVETEFFMVFTNLPSEQVDGYLASLDAMYRELCLAFGLSNQKNVWCGKCVVLPFSSERDYLVFESVVMKNDDARGSQGLCHQRGNGEVIFAGFRRDNDTVFGSVLVHETSHGFIHRYLSSARIPSWLNEGMADWIANAIMKPRHIPLKQLRSAQLVKQNGGWGDFLSAKRISFDHYGSASSLVEILVSQDKGGQFREFFKGIKEGKAGEESLKDSFGISYADLTAIYAEYLSRIPD